MKKIKLVCPYCGSEEVVRCGPMEWDIDTQEWVSNGAVYDEMSCEKCGKDFNEAVEVPVD